MILKCESIKNTADIDQYGVNREKYMLAAVYPAFSFSKSMYETFNMEGWFTKNVYDDKNNLVMVRVYQKIKPSEVNVKGWWEQ